MHINYTFSKTSWNQNNLIAIAVQEKINLITQKFHL